jgi:hypothetical protein
MRYVTYTEGYRFQLEEDYQHETGIVPAAPGGNRFVHITLDGLLIVRAGYAWDGASGPAINTPNFIRGSLVHDALYQLMRLGVVPKAGGRLRADQLLREVVREDGMWPVRAWWVYHAVRLFGGQYMRSVPDRVLTAPRPATDAEAAP